MTTTMRGSIAAVLLAAGLALAAAGLFGLPAFGHYPGPYGDLVNAKGPLERHVTNMVTLVTFDIRGVDTLGEEFILLAAVTGAVLLLRGHRGESTSAKPALPPGRTAERSEAVTAATRIAVGIVLLFGLYVVLHAHLTPGGGFQGGAIIGSASLFLYLGDGYRVWRRLMRSALLDAAEAIGTGGFVLAGLAPMIAGAPFLANTMPLGKTGQLLSGGVILPINICVGAAVACGFAVLFVEFLEETRAERGSRAEREPASKGEQAQQRPEDA